MANPVTVWAAIAVAAALVASAHALPTYHVLVTGFGAFMNNTHNPSGDAAALLNNTCDVVRPHGHGHRSHPFKLCWEGWHLGVDHAGASEVQDAIYAHEGHQWAAVIHLGLAARNIGLRVETVGANILSETHGLEEIFPGEEPVLPTTVDWSMVSIRESVDRLRAASKATARRSVAPGTECFSRDAGDYYCNETLYRTLLAIRKMSERGALRRRGLLPAVFVHLPKAEDTPVDADVDLVRDLGAEIVSSTLIDY
eukprot:m51a1_g5539 hypothetical protein (254) ;mRNA; r:469498-470500